MDRDRDAEDDDVPSPEFDIRAKLKHVAHYAMLGFAPVVSIVALGVALFATGNQPDPMPLDNLKSNVDLINLSLLATKSDLDSLKFSMSREKSQRGEEYKKSQEIDAKIIQSVTRLQEKLKISPTLEEQLRAAAKAAAVAAAATIPASAAIQSPAMSDKQQNAAPASPDAEKKSETTSLPAETEKKAAVKEVAEKKAPVEAAKKPITKEPVKKPVPKPVPKLSPEVSAIKKAIDEYNKQ